MAAVLGVSAYYHDAAAALVVDGKIVAFQQEERLSRIKNDPSLPRRAIDVCLKLGGILPGDLDLVVYYEDPYAKLERTLIAPLQAYPHAARIFKNAMERQLGEKLWVLDSLADLLNLPRRKIQFIPHHQSHAASAYYTSSFSNAAVIVADAVGESATTSLWHGQANNLKLLEQVHYPHSLGLLYAAITAYLGFRVNEDEYKVMGLAAFGTPRLRDAFAKFFVLSTDGSFHLNAAYFDHFANPTLAFGKMLEQLLGPRRAPNKPWDLTTPEDQYAADVAATVQTITEEAMLALAQRAYQQTGANALCLAGGVALNAVANARVLRDSAFAHVFVQPAAGDAGGALGAAIVGALQMGDARPTPMSTAALGLNMNTDQLVRMARAMGFAVERVPNVAQQVAQVLAKGGLVALAEGRGELGPRALGQRSFLAAPERVETRDRLNRLVKQREPFRPFAPAVLHHVAPNFFDSVHNHMTPWMTTVCGVHQDKRSELGATTHVDGTARVQTIDAQQASSLQRILTAYENESGRAVVLNTSLNAAGEPMVLGVASTLGFFASHAVDLLVSDDVVISRVGG